MAEALPWDVGLYEEPSHRVVELAAWLNGQAEGWTFERADVIALSSWAHYADLPANTFNTAFATARRLVRSLGLEIESVDGKYRKRKRIRLTPQERQALLMALAVADPGEPRETAAIPFGLGIDRQGAVALLDISEEIDVLLEAIKEQCTVEISHRGRRRQVDPYGIGFRNGRWYLVGRDHTRDRVRVFGLGRSGPRAPEPALVGDPRSFDRPVDFDITSVLEGALDPARWNADAPVEATIRVDGDALQIASRLFAIPEQPLAWPIARTRDASVVDPQEISVGHLGIDALVRAMLALRTHAIVLEPLEVVDALCAHLEQIIGASTPTTSSRSPSLSTVPPLGRATRTVGGQLTPERRLQIITTTIALGEAQEETTHVDEVARIVHAKPEQVTAALAQFTNGSLVIGDDDLLVDSGVRVAKDGTITVTDPWLLDEWQPTLPQALRLFVAGKTALALTPPVQTKYIGSDVADARLRLACDKLAGYLASTIRGTRGQSAKALRQYVEFTAPTVPPAVAKMKAAIDTGRTLQVSYQVHNQTVRTAMVEVDPVHVRFGGGRWVLEGRIRRHAARGGIAGPVTEDDLEPVEETQFVSIPVDDIFDFRPGQSTAEFLASGFDVSPVHAPVEAKLELEADKLWLLDPYPLRTLYETPGGRFRATAVIPNVVELRTLVLRIGAAGRLRSPKELRDMPGAIAREILALYGR